MTNNREKNMKLVILIAVLTLGLSNAFAEHHEEHKKKMGHDKEHSHVDADKVDHAHDDGHHRSHDHKAHHPDHKDETKKVEKKK